jgi:biopolymer transport protein ExbD
VKVRRRPLRKARIEIVPMIDIMLFLLIFFMMASLAMTPMTGMKVNLPRADTGVRTNEARALITMTDRGDIYLDKQPVALEQVTPLLQARIAANPDTLVIVNADKTLQYDRVIALMDAAKRAAPKQLALATEPNPDIR